MFKLHLRSHRNDCPCGEITPNIVEGAGLSAYLSSPADSNGNKCIPSQACTYQLAYIVPDNIAIIGSVFKPTNFKDSGATLSFYDGNTASGSPYMTIDGNYDGNNVVQVISSLTKNITIVFDVANKSGSVPTFTYVSSSTQNIRTTTPPPTTTTPIPSPPYPIQPNSFLSEGDIFIYVDISSNVTLASEVGEEIVNALYINTDVTSPFSRVFIAIISDVLVLPFGWNNPKKFLENQFNNLKNMYTGSNGSTIEYSKLGSVIDSAFKDSLSKRPHVQRTLIFLTDNNNQITDNGISNYKDIINNYDIHPVLINIDPSKDVSKFSKILGAFSGDNTNQIVQVNYSNVTDLYENYLFNANVMCSISSLHYNGTDSFTFPIQPSTGGVKKNYCNYMNYTLRCAASSPSNITLKINEYDLEANGDFLKVYNDQGAIQAIFTGTLVTNSEEVINNTTFIDVVMLTNNHKVYPGVDIKFVGCTIV
uniref:VWFA domain-containing protein n=1 Tax=Strongyloides stercoralis TaxID=6248 RepID=A0AAF5HX94_STRER